MLSGLALVKSHFQFYSPERLDFLSVLSHINKFTFYRMFSIFQPCIVQTVCL